MRKGDPIIFGMWVKLIHNEPFVQNRTDGQLGNRGDVECITDHADLGLLYRIPDGIPAESIPEDPTDTCTTVVFIRPKSFPLWKSNVFGVHVENLGYLDMETFAKIQREE